MGIRAGKGSCGGSRDWSALVGVILGEACPMEHLMPRAQQWSLCAWRGGAAFEVKRVQGRTLGNHSGLGSCGEPPSDRVHLLN